MEEQGCDCPCNVTANSCWKPLDGSLQDAKRCAVMWPDAAASGYLLLFGLNTTRAAPAMRPFCRLLPGEAFRTRGARRAALVQVDWAYSENLRVELSNNLVQGLLQKYSMVDSCVDVDEFLVPDRTNIPAYGTMSRTWMRAT